MTTIDNIMALADQYATQRQHAHYLHETDARKALRAAIEQALTPGEPVAWMSKTGHGTYFRETITPELAELEFGGRKMWTPLYTAPQPQPKQEPASEGTLLREFLAEAKRAGVTHLQPQQPAEQPQPKQEPEGWKLVPVEPTWDMKIAASTSYREPRDGHYTARMGQAADCYRVMLAAAPQPPKQEPVAWMYWQSCLNDDGTQTAPWVQRYSKFKPQDSRINRDVTPLYTAPQPQREWVGLTDGEIAFCRFEARVESGPFKRDGTTTTRLARAIEAKLREKNGGGV